MHFATLEGRLVSQLHPIHEPDNPKAAVIFVHGLGGDPFATWWHDDDQPRDSWPFWLAEESSEAAVHTLAYDASPSNWLGRSMPLVDRATEMLTLLETTSIGQRPLVWITHSLGGLLVKQMLRHSDDQSLVRWQQIARQTKAVIFLATPHAGADLATWLDRLSTVLRAGAVIEDLRAHDPDLANLNQWYRTNAPNAGIATHCFFETQPTSKVLVVDRTSADPGMQEVVPRPVDADHLTICKPQDRQHWLCGYVAGIVRSAAEQTPIDTDARRPAESTSTGQSAVVDGGCNRTIQIAGSDNVVMVGDIGAAARPEPAPAEPDEPTFIDPLPMPADLDDFQAREEQAAELLDTLRGSGQVAITAIGGMGGIGKTALAVHVARLIEAQGETPDGQRYLDLQGVSAEPLEPAEAIGKLIQSFDPTARPPDEVEPAALLLRQMLDGRRVLLLLDNAKDGEQIRWLLDGRTRVPNAKILVTSRQTVTRDGPTSLRLGLMAPDEARTFLRTLLENRTASDEELAQLAMRCGHLPLALRVAGRFLQAHSTWSMTEYLDALASAEVELKLEGDPNKDVKAVLGLSAQRLADGDRCLARRWQTLVVFPTDFDRAAAASVWDCTERDARNGLDDLVGRSMLLFDAASRRYRLHDLMREVARLPLMGEEGAMLARRLMAAEERHAQHYCGVLGEANRLYLAGGGNVPTGLRLYDLEQRNIAVGQAWAAARIGESDGATRLAAAFPIHEVLTLRLHPRVFISWLEAHAPACRLLGDRRGEANGFGALGNVYINLGETRRAIDCFKHWLVIAREIGDRRGEGLALGSLGNAHADLGEPRRAIEHFEQTLAIMREIGDRRNEGNARGGLGRAYADLREPRRAAEHFDQRLAIAREIGDRRGEGNALGNLGLAYAALGEPRRAIEYYDQDLTIRHELGDRRGESHALNNWALALEALGEHAEALNKAETALVIKEGIEHPTVNEARALVARLRGS